MKNINYRALTETIPDWIGDLKFGSFYQNGYF